MADLDEEIATTAAEGYACDTLLDDRAEWQREREVLLRKAAEQDAVRALLND